MADYRDGFQNQIEVRVAETVLSASVERADRRLLAAFSAAIAVREFGSDISTLVKAGSRTSWGLEDGLRGNTKS